MTDFGAIWYNALRDSYILAVRPSFPSRSLRQEGGSVNAEESIPAFCMRSDFAVRFVHKSALTARVGSETVNVFN